MVAAAKGCRNKRALSPLARYLLCMKILVLGDSSSSGTLSDGPPWTEVMRDLLAEEFGESIEIEQKIFVATGEKAAGIAAIAVAEHEPDLVVLTVGNYVFTAPFVWLRVRRLFGRRVGYWFRDIEQSINSATYEKGRVRQRVNRALRAVAHRVIGAETITTREESARTLDETFQQLARAEDVQVVVVADPGIRKIFRDPRQEERRKFYNVDVKASAEARHFLFVDTTPAFVDKEDGTRFIQSDGLHGTYGYQAIMGEYAASAYLRHVQESSRPTGRK